MGVMGRDERKRPRARRSFTAELKAEIVELCQRGDRSTGRVCRDFDLTETAVASGCARPNETRHVGGRGDPQTSHGVLRDRDPVNVYRFIEAEKAQPRNVKWTCELLEVSCAASYAQRLGTPSARQVADAGLTEQIRQAHQAAKGRYGPPRIHAALRRRGHHHGRKRVARLMHCAGLRGRAPRRWNKTTVPDPAAAARADLIRRDFTINAAAVNTCWCGDITYIWTWEGWLYLATVIDIASRRVVGFALAEHLRTELACDALANAVAARDSEPGVVFHSDKGCQYVSGDYATLAEELTITLSVGRTGQCWATRSPNRSSPP